MFRSILLSVFLAVVIQVKFGLGSYPSYMLYGNDVEVETDFRHNDLRHSHGHLVSLLSQPQKIVNTDDIIQLLEIPLNNQESISPLAEKIILVLRDPIARQIVDRILLKHPDLPEIIRGLRLFITGPEAKPLIDAVKTVLPPLFKAFNILVEKIRGPLEEMSEVVVEEAVKLYFLLQSPEVIEVIQKFQRLPEVLKIAEHLKTNLDFDLLASLQMLENLLK